jgi:hypothetical protein
MISIDDLKTAVEASWDASTSFCADEWTRANPTRGQCVVTSLLVQAYFGGELRKYDAVYNGQEESHYCNVLPDGQEIDLTRQQYPAAQKLTLSEVNLHGHATVREKMMHETRTVRAYQLLLDRVATRLGA